MRKILLVVIMTKSTIALAQIDWRTPITLNEADIPVVELLEKVASQSETNISNGFDNIPADLTISIFVQQKSLPKSSA